MTDIKYIPNTRIVNIEGNRYGRLAVVSYAGKKNNNSLWICKCDCGGKTLTQGGALKNGGAKSCGCLQKETMKKINTTHGKTKTTEYNSWYHLKQRCLNPNNHRYKDYGGRGITVCDRWLNSFENFLADMGEKPTPKHSIDRIDNKLGYFKENCRWSTPKEQANNTRWNVILEFEGKSMSVNDWAKFIGLSCTCIYNRIHRKKSLEDILKKPN